MADFNKKNIGRPAKGAKKRQERLDLRASKDEIGMLDELRVVLNKRRGVGLSRMDCLAYLIEREYEKQDSIRVISKAESPE